MNKTFQIAGVAEPTLGRVLKIALPIVMSRASFMAMLFIDRFFLSRVGKYELAASMSGGLTSFAFISFFVGLVGYVTALVSQYYGARRYKMCTRATIQALYAGLASYPLLLALIPFIQYVFEFAGQDAILVELSTVYARMLLGGSILQILRTVLASFFVGIGKTRTVMMATVAGTLINVPLNYIFIFGKLGLPAMGIHGAALGTICGSLSVFVLLLISYLHETSQAPFRAAYPMRFMPDIMKRLFRFGLPAGVEPFLNFFAFNVFVQMMQSYSPDIAAASTIALNWDAMVYIPMVGLSVAATILAGQHLGAKDKDGAKQAVFLTLRVAFVFSAVMIMLFVGLSEALVQLFSLGFQDSNGQIADTSTKMLRILCLNFLAIAAKLVLNGLLRAAGDTVWIMWVSIAIHWGMAVATIILVRIFAVNPFIAWSMLTIMNNAHAISIYYRYRSGYWRTTNLIN